MKDELCASSSNQISLVICYPINACVGLCVQFINSYISFTAINYHHNNFHITIKTTSIQNFQNVQNFRHLEAKYMTMVTLLHDNIRKGCLLMFWYVDQITYNITFITHSFFLNLYHHHCKQQSDYINHIPQMVL